MSRSENLMATYDQNQEPLIFSKQTIDRLLGTDNPAECLALYTFYYYTAKWQHSDKAYATASYCMAALGWGKDRFRSTKQQLLALGIVTEYKQRSAGGQIVGHYMRINFIWNHHEAGFPPGGFQAPKCFETNTEENKKERKANQGSGATPKDFDDVWPHFPVGTTASGNKRSHSKASARKAWVAACTARTFQQCRPPLKEIAIAILQHMATAIEDKQYMPMPTTIINQGRWEDYPELLASSASGVGGDRTWLQGVVNKLQYRVQSKLGYQLEGTCGAGTTLRALSHVWQLYDPAAHAYVADSPRAWVQAWVDWLWAERERFLQEGAVSITPGRMKLSWFLAAQEGK